MHARITRALLIACAMSAGCRHEVGMDEAIASSKPHLETFARFTHWAKQTRNSDVASRGRAALAEATFAPLRREPDVIAAFVRDQLASDVAPLAMPEGGALPLEIPWKVVRDKELGAFRVAVFAACPVAKTRAKDSRPACVFLEKDSDSKSDDAIVVTVAFKLPSAEN